MDMEREEFLDVWFVEDMDASDELGASSDDATEL